MADRRTDPVPARQERPLSDGGKHRAAASRPLEEGRSGEGDELLREAGDAKTGDDARAEEREPTES